MSGPFRSRLLSDVAWPSASGRVNSGARAPIASMGLSGWALGFRLHHSRRAGWWGKAERGSRCHLPPLSRSGAGTTRHPGRAEIPGCDWTGCPSVLESRALRGAVAQLGERRVRNAKVEGSISFRSTTFLPPRIKHLALRADQAEHCARGRFAGLFDGVCSLHQVRDLRRAVVRRHPTGLVPQQVLAVLQAHASGPQAPTVRVPKVVSPDPLEALGRLLAKLLAVPSLQRRSAIQSVVYRCGGPSRLGY